jgi:putative colanic acid biosynthesis UDP-glucose lipid carrier transferase
MQGDDQGMREQTDAYTVRGADGSLLLHDSTTDVPEQTHTGSSERLWRGDPRHAIKAQRKRVLDLVVGIPAALLCLPLCLLIAVAIVLDSGGPALFRQRRIGLHGKPFRIFKFRTMTGVEDASQAFPPPPGGPQVTRVGRLLRPWGLDELPQLLNVLAGDMSLVGPRPHAAAEDQHYAVRIPNYDYRRLVRPGMTGWAQVHGARGTTRQFSDMLARIDFDIWYVDHAAIGLDLLILAGTPLAILRGERRP